MFTTAICFFILKLIQDGNNFSCDFITNFHFIIKEMFSDSNWIFIQFPVIQLALFMVYERIKSKNIRNIDFTYFVVYTNIITISFSEMQNQTTIIWSCVFKIWKIIPLRDVKINLLNEESNMLFLNFSGIHFFLSFFLSWPH